MPEHAARRFIEFFVATIRNKNFRMALPGRVPLLCLRRAVQIGELDDIEPIHVAAYIEALQATAAKPHASWPSSSRSQDI
jgi:hypothetical protein